MNTSVSSLDSDIIRDVGETVMLRTVGSYESCVQWVARLKPTMSRHTLSGRVLVLRGCIYERSSGFQQVSSTVRSWMARGCRETLDCWDLRMWSRRLCASADARTCGTCICG
ncbi:hypothetical protein PI126_g16566 [Phytophthora idaei]|nr:hypothetical protein PI126_g16566 [Phytophthora idaei]